MAVDDIIGIQIHGRYQQQNIVNLIHYQITEQTFDEMTILGNLCVAWETANKTAWLARHIDTYSLMGLKAFSLTGDNKLPGIRHIDEAGAVVGTEAPSPLCRTLTLYTGSDNYRRRGRVMLSGSADTMFNDDDGAVTDAELTALVTLGTALLDDVGSGGNVCVPGLAPNGILPYERYIGVLARKTPALIRSRRVRGFSIG